MGPLCPQPGPEVLPLVWAAAVARQPPTGDPEPMEAGQGRAVRAWEVEENLSPGSRGSGTWASSRSGEDPCSPPPPPPPTKLHSAYSPIFSGGWPAGQPAA